MSPRRDDVHYRRGNHDARFGAEVRGARRSLGRSQEEVAHAAGISTRHLSFLETGRANPSPEVALRLGQVLAFSARGCNALLGLAGYAPAVAPAELETADRALALQIVAQLLAAQAPYPAIATDALGYVIDANAPAALFFTACLGRPLGAADNLFALFFHDARLRALAANWEQLAPAIARHLRAEVEDAPDDARGAALLASIPEPLVRASFAATGALPIFELELAWGERKLRFTSSFSTFGVPHDATRQRIRLECFFPADRATRELVESLAAAGAG